MQIDDLLRTFENQESVKIRMGIRPSGIPHLATAQVINTCLILGKELIQRGHKASIDFTFADLLLPSNYICYGLPLKYQQVNSAQGTNLAAVYGGIIQDYIQLAQSFIELRGIAVPHQIHWDSQIQLDEKYRANLKNLLSKMSRKSFEDMPVNIICPECHRTNKTRHKHGVLISKCKEHGSLEVDVEDLNAELYVHFITASAMRTLFFNSDIHVIGRDHQKTGHFYTIQEITSLMSSDLPSYFLTPLFPGLSKSKMTGTNIKDMEERYGDRYACVLVSASQEIIRKGWKTISESHALSIIDRFAKQLE